MIHVGVWTACSTFCLMITYGHNAAHTRISKCQICSQPSDLFRICIMPLVSYIMKIYHEKITNARRFHGGRG